MVQIGEALPNLMNLFVIVRPAPKLQKKNFFLNQQIIKDSFVDPGINLLGKKILKRLALGSEILTGFTGFLLIALTNNEIKIYKSN